LPTVIGREWALLALLAFPVVALASRRRDPRRLIFLALLTIYFATVIAVTVFPIYLAPPSWRAYEPWWQTLRLIPLVVPPVGFALNIVMFVPLGVLLPLVWPPSGTIRRVFWWGLTASAAIEFTQLAMWITVGNRRYVDVNDLLSNTAGAVLGLLLLQTLAPRLASSARA
jgi:glycopeptide antibiotics resistance protein